MKEGGEPGGQGGQEKDANARIKGIFSKVAAFQNTHHSSVLCACPRF